MIAYFAKSPANPYGNYTGHNGFQLIDQFIPQAASIDKN
jgi:hypothetical protein